jgi:hypothetical protein
MVPIIGKENRGLSQLIIALRRKKLMQPKTRLSVIPDGYVREVPYGNPFVFHLAMTTTPGSFWCDMLMNAQERRNEWESKVRSRWKQRGLVSRRRRVPVVVKGWDQYGCPVEEIVYSEEILSAAT